jgi:hypothetical protein
MTCLFRCYSHTHTHIFSLKLATSFTSHSRNHLYGHFRGGRVKKMRARNESISNRTERCVIFIFISQSIFFHSIMAFKALLHVCEVLPLFWWSICSVFEKREREHISGYGELVDVISSKAFERIVMKQHGVSGAREWEKQIYNTCYVARVCVYVCAK